MTTTLRLAAALALLTVLLVAGSASAQAVPAHIPAGYETAGYETAASAVSQAPLASAPVSEVDAVIAASLAGDHRLALRTLSELERAAPRSPRLHVLRGSIEMRLDPRVVLTLSFRELESLSRELAAIHAQRMLGIGLGAAAAISGGLSLVTMLGAVLGSVQCTSALIIPICGPTTPDQGVMTAAAVLGGASLVLTGVSIGMLADAGSRQGRVASALRVSGGASADGASVSLSGSF